MKIFLKSSFEISDIVFYYLLSVCYFFHIVKQNFVISESKMMNDDESAFSGTRRARGRPRGWDDKTQQNTIKSLDRAMEVFEYLSTAQGKSLTALAKELGVMFIESSAKVGVNIK